MSGSSARLLALGSLLLCTACHKEAAKGDEAEGAEKPGPVTVVVEKVGHGTISDVIETAGNLDPPPGMDVKLGALVVGRLAQLPVSEGDHVKAGQLLARVESGPLQDAVRQADAALRQARTQEETAKARLTRTERLVKEGIAARQEEEDARAQEAAAAAAVHTAEAGLSTAQAQLNRATLKAPFDGVVAHVFAAAGEPVDGSGKPVVEVARTEVLELRAGLTASQAVRVRPGQQADIRLDGLPDRVFSGQVLAVAPVVDPATGVAIARIRVPNPEGILKGGAFGRARLVIDTRSNVVVIPKSALVPGEGADGGTATAMVEVVDNGQAQRRPVELGYSDGQRVEIRDGLKEGDSIIVKGAYALPDGTPVKAEAAAESEAPTDGGQQTERGP